jgi:hypothetical protein
LAKEFVGATLVRSTLECSSDEVRAYAGEKNGAQLLTVINKTEQAAAIKTPMRRVKEQWLLSGPAIDAKEGVALTRQHGHGLKDGFLHMGPHSAVLVKN